MLLEETTSSLTNLLLPESYCPECGRPLTNCLGRMDRRFCSVECKNKWHNKQRGPNRDKEVQRIVRILYRNRSVLERIIRLGFHSLDLTTLQYMGFSMSYFTSLTKVRHRWVYTCLDFAYELTPSRIKNIRVLAEEPGCKSMEEEVAV